MEYLKKSFSVAVGGADFARGWEAAFGKKKPVAEPLPPADECTCGENFMTGPECPSCLAKVEP